MLFGCQQVGIIDGDAFLAAQVALETMGHDLHLAHTTEFRKIIRSASALGTRQPTTSILSWRTRMDTSDSIQKKPSYAKNYRKTPKGAAACAWNRLTSRAGAKYNFSKCYANIEVRMTRDEFIAWAIPQYEAWFRDRPNEIPSIDRIDSKGHYEIVNLRLIERIANIAQSSKFKNNKAPEGQLWCSACQQYLPIENFSRDSHDPYGRRGYCKSCDSQKRKKSHETNRDAINRRRREQRKAAKSAKDQESGISCPNNNEPS